MPTSGDGFRTALNYRSHCRSSLVAACSFLQLGSPMALTGAAPPRQRSHAVVRGTFVLVPVLPGVFERVAQRLYEHVDRIARE